MRKLNLLLIVPVITIIFSCEKEVYEKTTHNSSTHSYQVGKEDVFDYEKVKLFIMDVDVNLWDNIESSKLSLAQNKAVGGTYANGRMGYFIGDETAFQALDNYTAGNSVDIRAMCEKGGGVCFIAVYGISSDCSDDIQGSMKVFAITKDEGANSSGKEDRRVKEVKDHELKLKVIRDTDKVVKS